MIVTRPRDTEGKLTGMLALAGAEPGTALQVGPADICVVFKEGHVLGRFAGGQHSLSVEGAPFLGPAALGDGLGPLDLVFVTMQPLQGQSFGGDVGLIPDPRTRQNVRVRIHGAFTAQPTDPEKVAAAALSGGEAVFHRVRGALVAAARDAVSQAVLAGRIDLDDPAAGAATLGVQLANDASTRLVDVGVRVLAVQETRLDVSGGSTHESTSTSPAAPVAGASEAQQIDAGGMPPDPLTSARNALVNAMDPRRLGVRVRGRDGAAVQVSARGIKVDKESVKDAVKRKVSRKVFGCVISLVILGVAAAFLGVAAVFILWIVYTST